MENWITVLLVALLSVGMIVGLSALCAVALLGAGKRFRQKQAAEDAKKIQGYLPGMNCGTCGYASCQQFAEEVAWQAELVDSCPYLSEQQKAEITTLLGEYEQQLQERRKSTKAEDQQNQFFK